MKRILLGACVAFSLTLPTQGAAQQSDALRAISALIDDANKEVLDVQSVINRLEGRLSAWDATLKRYAGEGRVTLSTEPGSQSDRDLLAQQVANHPVVALADAECRDDFRAVALPQLGDAGRFRTERLESCAAQIQATARQPVDMNCASLSWSIGSSGTLALTGYVQDAEGLEALGARFGAQTVSAVELRPEPVCTALTALELPMTSQNRPQIDLLSRKSKVGINESLAFEVTTPNFYSFMYLAYLQADGSVVNLLPRRALLRRQYPPKTQLVFGDGREGRQTYTASLPTGTEAIISITSRSPIDVLEDLEVGASGQYAKTDASGRVLNQAVFLDLLKSSMEDLAGEGRGMRQTSAEILHLTVVN
ncbi:hypothetical protein [Algirhabdus cladophorae]|uniref:hypothetical protein n=1 Tax=Algirhabdus cladophorae TaxID=3377108 RepID=UPI003B845C99